MEQSIPLPFPCFVDGDKQTVIVRADIKRLIAYLMDLEAKQEEDQ